MCHNIKQKNFLRCQQKKFHIKRRLSNIGNRMNSISQFHQRFTQAFFIQNFGAKNYKAKM